MLDLISGTDKPIEMSTVPSKISSQNNITQSSNTQDLLDLLTGIDLSAPVLNTNVIDNNLSATNGNNILSMPVIMSPTATMPTLTSPSSLLSTGVGIFDELSSSVEPTNPLPTGIKLTALDKNGLCVILVPVKIAGCLQVTMTATNSSLTPIEQFLFQAAVPRSFTLQMLSPSSSILPPGGTITQEMRLTSSAKVSVLLCVPDQ